MKYKVKKGDVLGGNGKVEELTYRVIHEGHKGAKLIYAPEQQDLCAFIAIIEDDQLNEAYFWNFSPEDKIVELLNQLPQEISELPPGEFKHRGKRWYKLPPEYKNQYICEDGNTNINDEYVSD